MLGSYPLKYEALPSEAPIREMVRQRRRQATIQAKKDIKAMILWGLTLPGVLKHVVANLRRVKR